MNKIQSYSYRSDLARELEGALVNSEGTDFHIDAGFVRELIAALRGVNIEWHSTPQLWVAYRGCGCEECPKGLGRTKEEAIADLEASTASQNGPGCA